MATTARRTAFRNSDEYAEIVQALRVMESDDTFNTGSSYSANSELYPDNLISFVDKHVNYLSAHPSTNPRHYIANLRLITRVR